MPLGHTFMLEWIDYKFYTFNIVGGHDTIWINRESRLPMPRQQCIIFAYHNCIEHNINRTDKRRSTNFK